MKANSFEGSIYVVHAKKGYEIQEKRVSKLFRENNLEFEFVTDGDPSLFTNDFLKSYFTEETIEKQKKGTLSCTLNHILSLKKMIEKGDDYAIIFENDPFFLGEFNKKLERILDEAKKLDSGFIISLENTTLTFPSFWKTKRGKTLYAAPKGRMAGAYLIDRKAASDIIEDNKTTKCDNIIDWYINSLIERRIIRMYWAHPPLVEQGSHNGMMSGEISSKNKNLFRRIKWQIQKFYKMYILRFFYHHVY